MVSSHFTPHRRIPPAKKNGRSNPGSPVASELGKDWKHRRPRNCLCFPEDLSFNTPSSATWWRKKCTRHMVWLHCPHALRRRKRRHATLIKRVTCPRKETPSIHSDRAYRAHFESLCRESQHPSISWVILDLVS